MTEPPADYTRRELAPDAAKMATLAAGDFVKIIRGPERVWCRILTIPHDRHLHAWSGIIENDLVNTDEHGLETGDRISLRLDEFIEVLKAGKS